MGMTKDQKAAAMTLRRALSRVKDAGLKPRVFDGSVWVVPEEVELWPNGDLAVTLPSGEVLLYKAAVPED